MHIVGIPKTTYGLTTPRRTYNQQVNQLPQARCRPRCLDGGPAAWVARSACPGLCAAVRSAQRLVVTRPSRKTRYPQPGQQPPSGVAGADETGLDRPVQA